MASSDRGTDDALDDAPAPHRIAILLDDALRERGMTLTELSARTGITMANLSALKNDRGKAIRFSTLTLVCDALEIQPGRLFALLPRPTDEVGGPE